MTRNNPENMDTSHLVFRIAALEQLLEVYENSVLEQADKLYEEITERKRVEAIVREREERFRLLFDAAHDPILLLDDTSSQVAPNFDPASNFFHFNLKHHCKSTCYCLRWAMLRRQRLLKLKADNLPS